MKRTNEVSKLVGVSRRTLQYYDDEGVLVVERSKNNHRMYDQKTLESIWEIMLYKEMGFELKEIKELLTVSDTRKSECFKRRMEEIKNRISKLKMQIEWISLVQKNGMPPAPVENDGITYLDRIEELKRKTDRYGL